MEYESKSDRWQFENEFCTEKHEVWIHEAVNLMYSAKVINDYSWNFNNKYPTFWTFRIEGCCGATLLKIYSKQK